MSPASSASLGSPVPAVVSHSEVVANVVAGQSPKVCYLAMLIGLLTFLFGAVRLIELAAAVLGENGGGLLAGSATRPSQVAEIFANILVGLVVWLSHWAYANRLLESTDWRGSSEKLSRTRAGYFVLVIGMGAIGAIFEFSLAVTAALSVPLGTPPNGHALSVLHDIIGPVAIGLLFAAVWWGHRLALIRERGRLGTEQETSARRVDGYTVAALALAFGASALAWLVGIAFDVVAHGQRTLAANGDWHAQLGMFLGFAIAGLSLWLLELVQFQRWRRRDEQGEADSTARRTYLLLVSAGALLGGLAGLVVLLNRVIGALVGANSGRSLTSEVSTSVGVLTMAILVLALHYWWFRRDQRVVHLGHGALEPQAAYPSPEEPAQAPAPVARALVLRVPLGGDADLALEQIRQALPDGYAIEEAG